MRAEDFGGEYDDAALDATRNLVARSILEGRSERGELVFRFQIPLSRM